MRFDPQKTWLAGVSRATLQLWLNQAQDAYAALSIGDEVVVTISHFNKSVTYQKTDLARLEAFIGLIQRCLGLNHGRRALRPIYR